jgi:CubicO group peptidase (beta-lactamase class C family)
MTSAPGEKFDYSNSGYALAAAIIEKVTGSTFEDYCAEQVFAPAGMKSATMIGCPKLDLGRVPKIARGAGFTDRPKEFAFAYGNELNWGYRGCGGIVASTRDLFAWDRALRDGKFLSRKSLDELHRPAVKDYALGWEIRKTPEGTRAEHSGGVLGVVTWYARHLDADYVIALACSYEPKSHPAQIGERLARIVTARR